MKKFVLILLLSIYSFGATAFPVEVSKCATCHNLADTENQPGKAPLMRDIVNSVKANYNSSRDQKTFLYDFLVEPSKCENVKRVLCEEHSTKKYGLMKDIQLTPMESLIIVNFLIDNF